MGQSLLTSGPSSKGVEGESKRAFAYEVLLPGKEDSALAGAFRSDFHPGDRPLGTMTSQGQIWMCLASHQIRNWVVPGCRYPELEPHRCGAVCRSALRSGVP